MKKLILLSLAMVSIANKVQAQQAPMYGQYVFNKCVINPANAGVDELNQIGVLYRQQWVGVKGAPRTTSIFYNTRLSKSLGTALSVYQDQIGPISDYHFQADLAGHIRISRYWNASVGLRVDGRMLSTDLSKLNLQDQTDPSFYNTNSELLLNLGAGFTFYSDKSFIGLSVPSLFNQKTGSGSVNIVNYEQHMFLYGGYEFELNDQWSFQPSALAKFIVDAPIQLDLNAIMRYNETFDMGLMLRSTDAIGMLLGVALDNHWYMGYMYEYPLNDMRQLTIQSHEISLRYRWKSKIRRGVISPRILL